MSTTHPSQKRGASQSVLILGRLSATPGEWVSLPELAAVSRSMAVHSRINDLRKLGYTIEHKNEHVKVGCQISVHSSYRLVPITEADDRAVAISSISNPQSEFQNPQSQEAKP